jgi:ankyrin repeat protein
MKKINALLLCTLLYSSINAEEQQTPKTPKIFQDIRNGDKQAIQEQLYKCENFAERDKDGNTVFHIAAQEGEEEILHMIIESIEYHKNPELFSWSTIGYKPAFPTLDDVNKNGDTPLHSTIVHHDTNTTKNEKRAKIAQYLLNKKPELVEKCNKNNKTPMELVIDSDNISLLLLLFEKKLNVYLPDNTIKPIHYAAANGKYNTVNHILNNNISSVDERDKDGNPPLFHTIDSNNEPMLNYLASRGANLHLCNNQGENAFAIATYNKHVNLINLLKNEYHIDIDARDKNGRTALMRSTIEQNHEIMKQQIELGANIRITDNARENILHKSARIGDQKGAQIALQYDKGLLSDANVDGNIPVFTAIQNGHFKLAQILLNAGSNNSNTNNEGNSILHEVAKKNNDALLTELLQTNPNLINHKNKNGETPLFFAAHNNNVAAIRNLIQHNAEFRYITNIHGLTPMHDAATADAIDAIKELERQGVPLTDCTTSGTSNTTAHIAASYGSIKTIRYILQTQPGLLEICNKEGDNVFAKAARHNQLEATKLLFREEYYLNGTINRIINSFTNNSATRDFLINGRNNRSKQCEDIYKTYNEIKNLITINRGLVSKLSENHQFYSYVPSRLDGELLITSSNDLWNMYEAKRLQLNNQYVQAYNRELNQKVNFEQELARIERKKQEALEQKLAAERTERARIEQEKQEAIARKLAAERAEQERILQKQRVELAYRQAELERIEQERKAQQRPAPAPSAPSPAQPPLPAKPVNDAPVKTAKMKNVANKIRSEKATPEEISYYITESKKIIARNIQSQKMSQDEGKELLKIALRIGNQDANKTEIIKFIERINKAIEEDEE